MLSKILVGLDGSPGSFRALEEAIQLAVTEQVSLSTVSVLELPRFPGTIDEVQEEQAAADSRYEQVIARARAMAAERRVQLDPHILIGHQVKRIVEFVKENEYDLLVIGFMGHSALYERVMGGTCQNLVRLAPCSVFVVK
jgi:nucleotide-binding universal stress UspA family protein